MAYTTLMVEHADGVLTVTLNRPEVHNAFNDELIAEAIDLFSSIDVAETRAVVLEGTGKNFCAGADLNWMSRMVAYSRDENIRDSSKLAKMYAVMNECPVPIVGRIQGAAIGGGVGLVSVCDIAIALAGTQFGLSEVKLGILPAVISPYVIAKIGETHARALFTSGRRFDAVRAQRIGLVHELVEGLGALDDAVGAAVTEQLAAGPTAARAAKAIVREVRGLSHGAAKWHTARVIARQRTSDEAQEGFRAFDEKRRPAWTPET
jgi:methylglutaconyl-CoA hydratase